MSKHGTKDHSHLDEESIKTIDPLLDSLEDLAFMKLRERALRIARDKGAPAKFFERANLDDVIRESINVAIISRAIERLILKYPKTSVLDEVMKGAAEFQMCEKFGDIPDVLERLKSKDPDVQKKAAADALDIAKKMINDIDTTSRERDREERKTAPRDPREILAELRNHPDVSLVDITPQEANDFDAGKISDADFLRMLKGKAN